MKLGIRLLIIVALALTCVSAYASGGASICNIAASPSTIGAGETTTITFVIKGYDFQHIAWVTVNGHYASDVQWTTVYDGYYSCSCTYTAQEYGIDPYGWATVEISTDGTSSTSTDTLFIANT